MFWKRSIAGKISAYAVLVILVISGGLGLLAYYYGTAAVVAEVERSLELQAQEASRYVATTIDHHFEILTMIASQPDMKWMDWSGQRFLLRNELERLEEFEAFGVVSPSGYTRYSDSNTEELGDLECVQKAFLGEPNISELFIDEASGEPILMYAVPIWNADVGGGQAERVVGVFVAKRAGISLNDLTDQLGFGDSGWSYLLGKDGTIYAYPDRDLVLSQVNVYDSRGPLASIGKALKTSNNPTQGIIRYQLFGRDTCMVGLAPVSGTGWTMAIGALEKEVLGNVHRLGLILLLASLGFVVAGGLLFAFAGKRIATPLKRVQAAVEALAEGDLTQIIEINTSDEVGIVADAVHQTAENLRQILGGVFASTEDLAMISQEMSANTQEVSASIEEVASTTNIFSSQLDAMNTNAQAMTTSVAEVSNKAMAGEEAIAEIISQITDLGTSIQSLAEEAAQLGQISDQVGSIVNVITEIAEQTNLLALNAAIEAARAGEHGRGFAVVADEVRNLAEQSAKATGDITELIRQIQGGVDSTVAGMQRGTNQAEQSLLSVNESGVLLREILESISGIVTQVAEISIGLEQVNTAGHDIASATEEQAASMAEMAGSAQTLDEMATHLQQLVSRFTL